MAYKPSVKVSGTWKEITDIHTKVSGTWKRVTDGYVKNSGTWKRFYQYEQQVTLSSNTADYNLFTAMGSPSGQVRVRLTINSGVYVYASSTGGYALTLSGFASGSEIIVINNGYIAGKGGIAGAGGSQGTGSPPPAVAGDAGAAGGPALYVATMSGVTVTIDNTYGEINGGGGGGGGGGSGFCQPDGFSIAYLAGGGGGGGGRCGAASAAGGAGGTAYHDGVSWWGVAGAAGSYGDRSSYGGGGAGGNSPPGYCFAGNGGNGGGWGSTGATGGTASGDTTWLYAYAVGGSGGAGGAAVYGNSNITWTATGTRNGSIS